MKNIYQAVDFTLGDKRSLGAWESQAMAVAAVCAATKEELGQPELLETAVMKIAIMKVPVGTVGASSSFVALIHVHENEEGKLVFKVEKTNE